MDVQIKRLGDLRVVGLEHRGDYTQIGSKFGELMPLCFRGQIPMREAVAIYYDDPTVTPIDRLRSFAGVIVPEEFSPSNGQLSVETLHAGEYAVTTHFGPYSELSEAWNRFFVEGIPPTGRKSKEAPCFDMYMNDCNSVRPEEVRTDLYVPLR